MIQQLRDDIGKQKVEIQYLRHLLETCAGCQPQPEPVKSNCDLSNPCFQGVQCFDTTTGVRCGHCPRGYIGDGRSCNPGYTCTDHPCFT